VTCYCRRLYLCSIMLLSLCCSHLYGMKFHYHLGKALNSFCDGKDVGDILFLIANQINHGHEWILGDDELSIAFAKLNMRAGKRALDGCDHKTAYSYLKVALSLLPTDHWESHHDLSLRLNFLASSAANSCCHYVEAERMLQRIFERSRCFEDKVPSYLLLSQSKCSNQLLLFALLFYA